MFPIALCIRRVAPAKPLKIWRREWEKDSRLNSSGRTNIFVARLLAMCWYTQRAQATILPDDFCLALAQVY